MKCSTGSLFAGEVSSSGFIRNWFNLVLHDLYYSSSIITIDRSRRMEWAGHIARMGEKTTAYRLLLGKPQGKRPL
jgi:hypothetical protein